LLASAAWSETHMTDGAIHLTTAQLEAGLSGIRESPRDSGIVRMIVRRPTSESREVLDECALNAADGVVGDSWRTRASADSSTGVPDPDTQLTLMNARAIQLIATDPARWPLAGDQLYIDMDLSGANLPPGTRLALGTAVIEITAEPHTGCKKFVQRYGLEAMKFVNSPAGRELSLRGIYAKVVRRGVARVGDRVTKCGDHMVIA
jgi:hypothetical protein